MTNISELGRYSLCLEYFQPVLQDQDDSSCREASWVEEEYEVSSVYVKQKSFFTHWSSVRDSRRAEEYMMRNRRNIDHVEFMGMIYFTSWSSIMVWRSLKKFNLRTWNRLLPATWSTSPIYSDNHYHQFPTWYILFPAQADVSYSGDLFPWNAAPSPLSTLQQL